MFRNPALRRIFEPKRDEVKGDWRRQHVALLSYIILCSKQKCFAGNKMKNI
jgi:hypothetical protein